MNGAKNGIHQTLKGCRGICESKGHHLELEVTLVSFKSYFTLILLCHSDLVKTRVQIQFSEYHSSCHLIQKLLNDGHWKFVSDGVVVEFSVIYTKPS
jgi:hypothetical protein